MTGKELKERFANISDNDDVLFSFTDADGQLYRMKIKSADAERFISLKDAVFGIREYCFSRQGFMYSCRNCPFAGSHGMCIVDDLMKVDSNALPDDTIVLRRGK